MCGIAGIWGQGNIEPMVELLTHRGPDEEGYFKKDDIQLGIRRLKVIDLVTGSQPIYNEDKSVVVVFNGEIFNYKDLRSELKSLGHEFTTQTDTEVIVHGYEQWGQACLERFNGQFAFCIYDGKKLFLARDRMGEKPLYYYLKDNRFLFASEIKAIVNQVDTQPDIDEAFWVFDAAVQGKTLFTDVHELQPAHCLVYDGEKLTNRTYWEIPVEQDMDLPEDKVAARLAELLEDAVMMRMQADVPVGMFLSGGIDSAAMTCFARPDVVFSCRFPLGDKFDEFHYAKMVAEHVGARQVVVTPTEEDMRRRLAEIIWHLDQPIATASTLSEFMLAEAARKHVTVVLGGQGADELFNGYIRHLFMETEHSLGRRPEIANYYSLARFFWNPHMFGDPAHRYYLLIHRATPSKDDPYIATLQELFQRHDDLPNAMGYTDIQLSLPSLIHMNDRATAAVGLENRSPFLDHRLVEFAFRMPPGLKLREFKTKYILRKALRGVVPDPILDRKDKKGLVVPFRQWLYGPLLQWGKDLKASLHSRIAVPGGAGRGEFDRDIYTRVCLELWFQKFFPNYYER